MSGKAPLSVDAVVHGATLITLNSRREVITDGALAIKRGKIALIGKTEDVLSSCVATEQIDGRNFVVTPGLIDGHVHITGDPLTRGVKRGGLGLNFTETLLDWVIPIFHAHTPADEKVSAKFAAIGMLKYGVTSFIEAGTISHLDAVVEGLRETGIRARVGGWVEGRSFNSDASTEREALDQAINVLETEIESYPDSDQAKIAAWPLLIGHSVNPEEVWRAAKQLSDQKRVRISAHMSPLAADVEWFLEHTGKRPIEYLDSIGVLGENVILTHVAHIDERELEILARTGTNVVFCPYAALKGAFGATSVGLFPEMSKTGINVMLGTDGVAVNLLQSARLMAGMFNDARMDETIFDNCAALEMITINGADGLGAPESLGSLEIGKKADFACFDTDCAEWFPSFDIVDQVLQAASQTGAHSVWVDGIRVVENGQSTLVDEEELIFEARASGADVMKRTDLPVLHDWPVI